MLQMVIWLLLICLALAGGVCTNSEVSFTPASTSSSTFSGSSMYGGSLGRISGKYKTLTSVYEGQVDADGRPSGHGMRTDTGGDITYARYYGGLYDGDQVVIRSSGSEYIRVFRKGNQVSIPLCAVGTK